MTNMIIIYILIVLVLMFAQIIAAKSSERYWFMTKLRNRIVMEASTYALMNRTYLAQEYEKWLSKNSVFRMWMSGNSVKYFESQLMAIKLTTKKR